MHTEGKWSVPYGNGQLLLGIKVVGIKQLITSKENPVSLLLTLSIHFMFLNSKQKKNASCFLERRLAYLIHIQAKKGKMIKFLVIKTKCYTHFSALIFHNTPDKQLILYSKWTIYIARQVLYATWSVFFIPSAYKLSRSTFKTVSIRNQALKKPQNWCRIVSGHLSVLD